MHRLLLRFALMLTLVLCIVSIMVSARGPQHDDTGETRGLGQIEVREGLGPPIYIGPDWHQITAMLVAISTGGGLIAYGLVGPFIDRRVAGKFISPELFAQHMEADKLLNESTTAALERIELRLDTFIAHGRDR